MRQIAGVFKARYRHEINGKWVKVEITKDDETLISVKGRGYDDTTKKLESAYDKLIAKKRNPSYLINLIRANLDHMKLEEESDTRAEWCGSIELLLCELEDRIGGDNE